MADIFDFSNPNTMGLLGAMAGLGQAAMPSRMPVPLASVLGQAAGGFAQGAQAAQAYQKAATENALQKLTLQGWQNYMNAMGGQPTQQGQQPPQQPAQMPQDMQAPSQPAAAPSGLDLSKLTPHEQAYLARKDPAAFSNGIQDFQNTSIQAANPPIPPGVKTPFAAIGNSSTDSPVLPIQDMVRRAQQGMFPGGWGPQQYQMIGNLIEKMTLPGTQLVTMPNGSLGVAPLSGIDQVRYMMANREALGKSMGDKQQQFDAQGNITPMPGSIESGQQTAFANEYGKSQGGLPAEMTKISAQGAQTRQTEAFKTQLENQNTTVAVPDGMGGTKLMLRGDANAIAQQNSAPPLPDTLDSKDMVSKATGTVIPAPKGQIPMKMGSAPNPEWIKEEQNWSSALPTSYQTEQKLLTLSNALKMTQSGWGAESKAKVGAMLQSIGVSMPKGGALEKWLGNPAEVQKIIHGNMLTTMGTLKDMIPSGSRITQMEFDRIGKALANPNLQPEANYTLLSEAIGALRQNRALMNSWQEAKSAGWSNPFAYQQAWLNKNPTSGFVSQAEKEIGPLKGMKVELPAGVTPADIQAELARRGLK